MSAESPRVTSAVRFAVDLEGRTPTTAAVYAPADPAPGAPLLILGHGAGAGQFSGFMTSCAGAFARRGVTAVTFNFPYSEAGRKVPDRAPVLEACFAAVISAAQARGDGARPLFIGGKSMGGRMASHLAASWNAAARGRLAGLVLLGYPLHPPGRPDQLRAAHLAAIRAPVFIAQGTSDAFGAPGELRKGWPHRPEGSVLLEVDGDHSFKRPRERPSDHAARLEAIWDAIARWMAHVSR